jgi:integrase
MLKIEKRTFPDGTKSKTYWVRGTIGGREVFRSAKTSIRGDAEQFALRLQGELVSEEERSNKKLFCDALALYLKRGKDLQYYTVINEKLGLYPLDEISQELMDKKAREAYPTQSNSSIVRWFYAPACAVLNYAAKILKWCPPVYIQKPKFTRPPAEWADLEWFEKLWPVCNDKLKALTTFLPYTGCRIGECLELTWEHINLEEGWAYIPKTKNRLPRTVELPEIVIQRLTIIKKDSGKVFEYKDRHAAVLALRRACVKAGITYKRPHAIGSHTFATWLRRYQGVDAAGLVATRRWKDPRSTYIYAHASTSEEAKKVHNLPGANITKTKKTARAKSVQKPRKARKA